MILLVSVRIINSNEITKENVSSYIPRSITQLDEIKDDATKIINEVKSSGNKAIIKFTEKFDGVKLNESEIQVTEEEINEAYTLIDKKLLNALKFAKQNLIKFHEAQIREEWSIKINKGVEAGQIFRPLESVGLYIPGGRAIYPSTVLMAATPAHVAGVQEIIMCSPPQEDKKIAPEIIVAAKEFNITKIFKVGGAQAIAAMAFGTETIPKVQKVIGPGNKWVNAAKQILSNYVAIDNPAGPSEILIIADDSVNEDFVIIDFLSQIEHDPDNVGIIVTSSSELIDKINKKIELFIEDSERSTIIKAALENSLIIKAKDSEDCIRISNIIAPEHLELLIKNPKDVIPKVKNAGAVFLGPYTPVPLGDYCAGTNHILPTGGNAKMYSGLNINDFLKIIPFLECNEEGLKTLYDSASTIAKFEGLYAHKESLEKRLKDKD